MRYKIKIVPFRKYWPVIILAGIICLMTTTTYGGNKKMEQRPLYDFKDSMTIEPQTYKIQRATPLSLFAVPFDSAVGTNDLNNALTVLSFPNGKLRDNRYFKNTLDDMAGSGIYLPLLSQNEVGFALGRLFLLFNFKTDTAKVYRLAFSIGKTPEKMAVAEWDKIHKRLLVEVQSMNNKSDDPWDYKNYLQLVELVGDRDIKLVKEMLIPVGTSWSIVNNMIFLWEFSDKKLQILDMNFVPSQHPLGDIINKQKGKFNFGLIYAHPTFPFAILTDTILSWGEKRDHHPKLLFESEEQYSFSPDGKWVTFKREDYSGKFSTALTYLMPVSEQYPHYLGTPILLIDRPFINKKFAWTTNPVAFVASGARDLYRWELTKEARKSLMGNDFDKYATFHDWIVAKDLEKLTKEKKQGLGK